MKRLFLLLFVLMPLTLFSQNTPNTGPKVVDAPEPTGPEEPVKLGSPSNRISFIIGPGASYINRKLYDDPVVNQTTDLVIINRATNIKSNLALGIIYTPKIYNITRRVAVADGNGQVKMMKQIEVVPKGRTFAAFINPVAFTKATESQSFFSMVDFGIGIGHRFAGGLLLMATGEIFSVRQPRKWFIDEYKDNNKRYEIGGSAQKSIDINDNTIFINKPAITFGFKVCYSFDIIKNYISGAQAIAATPVPAPTDPAPTDPAPTPPTPPTPTDPAPTPPAKPDIK